MPQRRIYAPEHYTPEKRAARKRESVKEILAEARRDAADDLLNEYDDRVRQRDCV